jgi:hypothetical protein
VESRRAGINEVIDSESFSTQLGARKEQIKFGIGKFDRLRTKNQISPRISTD